MTHGHQDAKESEKSVFPWTFTFFKKALVFKRFKYVHSSSPRPYSDAGGVVFYANYLKFFERARTEWLRSMGVQQGALQADSGVLFVVAEVHVRYVASAKLDDVVVVSVKVVERGQASMRIEQQAWRGEILLAEGWVRVGCVDATTMRPMRIPKSVSDALESTPG